MKWYGILCVMMVGLSTTADAFVHEAFTATEDCIQKVEGFGNAQPETVLATGKIVLCQTVHANKVYWAEKSPYVINRANLNGTDKEELLQVKADGLTVDKGNHKLYWFQGGAIFRSNLDGTEVETVVASAGSVGAMDIHYESSKLYWIVNNNGLIKRSNLDGTNTEDITPDCTPYGGTPIVGASAISVASDALYFISDSYSPDGISMEIYRTDLNGNNCEVVFSERPGSSRLIYSVQYNDADHMLYWAYFEMGASALGIRRALPFDAASEGVAGYGVASIPSTLLYFDIQQVGNTSVLWWAEPTEWIETPMSIVKRPLAVRTKLADVLLDPTTIQTAFEPNASVGHVYWAEMGNVESFPLVTTGSGAIYRVDSNGANKQTILSGIYSLAGLEVDEENGWLYWADFLRSSIYRATLDGENITNITAHLTMDGMPVMLALDRTHGVLYWTEISGMGAVKGLNLESGIMHTVVTGFNMPTGIAWDSVAGRIYFSDNNGIHRVHADGSNLTTLKTGHAPFGMALDAEAGDLYYLRNGQLARIRADGSYEGLDDIGGWMIALRTLDADSITILGPPRATLGNRVVLRPGNLPPLSGHISYEWYKDEVLIAGATSAEFSISALTGADAGVYQLIVMDESKGIYRSAPFTLEVTESPLPISGVFTVGLAALLIMGMGCRRFRMKQL